MSRAIDLINELLRGEEGEGEGDSDREEKIEESFTEGDKWGDWGDINKAKSNPLLHPLGPIDEATKDAIYSNCVEVNMIPLFEAKAELKGRELIQATLAIRISQLPHITPEQLEVWNIPRDYPFIAIRVAFCEFCEPYSREGHSPTHSNKITVAIWPRLSQRERKTHRKGLPFTLLSTALPSTVYTPHQKTPKKRRDSQKS